MNDDELFLLVLFGGPLLFTMIIVIYDFLAERQHRRAREQEHRRSA